MNHSQQQIEQTLLDVRRSYRLLHDYQRVVLDSVNYIGKRLEMNYAGGWPKFSGAAPKAGGGRLDNWAWDWLNMVFYEFHFHKELEDGEELRLSIFLISDSGYFSSQKDNVHKTEVVGFAPPESSLSKVGFIFSANGWPVNIGFLNREEDIQRFLETGNLNSEQAEAGYLARCYDISQLLTEQGADAIINEFLGIISPYRIASAVGVDKQEAFMADLGGQIARRLGDEYKIQMEALSGRFGSGDHDSLIFTRADGSALVDDPFKVCFEYDKRGGFLSIGVVVRPEENLQALTESQNHFIDGMNKIGSKINPNNHTPNSVWPVGWLNLREGLERQGLATLIEQGMPSVLDEVCTAIRKYLVDLLHTVEQYESNRGNSV